jgi:hypothetical protein
MGYSIMNTTVKQCTDRKNYGRMVSVMISLCTYISAVAGLDLMSAITSCLRRRVPWCGRRTKLMIAIEALQNANRKTLLKCEQECT